MSNSVHVSKAMLTAAVGYESNARARAVTNERQRAQSAEESLSGRVTACENAETANANAIAAERTRAEAAEAANAADIAANTTAIANKISTSSKGSAGGVAELDESGKVPASQLPGFVDDVVEFANRSAFPAAGETGKIYVAKDTNKTYRWSGTDYVVIGGDLAIGETAGTAYRGDRGKTAYNHSQATGSNPHGVTWDNLAGTKPTIPTIDDAMTQQGANGVKSSGIWSWVKGLLPNWLTSGYAEPATTASVAAKRDKTDMFTEWVCTPSEVQGYPLRVVWLYDPRFPQDGGFYITNDHGIETVLLSHDHNALYIGDQNYTATRDRIAMASDIVAPVAPSTSASDAGKPADAKATGDELAGKQTKITASGLLKGDGDGGVTAATAGTDYLVSHQELRYALATATGALADRTINAVTITTSAVALTFPAATANRARDFLIYVDASSMTTGTLSVTVLTGATVYGDAWPTVAATKRYLVTVTEIAANVFYVRSIELAAQA